MRRRCQHPVLVALLATLLTACRGGLAATPAPAATVSPVGAASAVTAAAQPPRPAASPARLAATPGTADWAALAQRPLHLPALGPSGVCPVTAWQAASKVDAAGDFPSSSAYFAFGKGPIYPLIYHFLPAQGVVRYDELPNFSGTGKQDKVLWLARPSYGGPALIRGRQRGGAGVLRFGPTDATPTELRFPIDTGVSSADTAYGWRDRPSYMVIPTAGCYAFQVDGQGFSDVIVFQVSP